MECGIDRRLGNRVGIFFIVWLALLDVFLVWAATQLPISIITFVVALIALITVPIIGFLVYWLIGLNRSAYLMDRNALTIQWGAVQQIIPMASIRQLLHGSEITEHVRYFRGGRWPGHWVGQGEVQGIGPMLFYAAGGFDQQLVIVTPGVAYAIAPADMAGFVEAFDQRQKMGPTQEVIQGSIRPEVFDWPLWTDWPAMGLVGVAGLACLLLIGYTCWRFPELAPRVALHFDALGTPDLFAPRSQVFLLPAIGLLSLGVNVALGLPMYLRDRVSAYLLWSGALVVQVLAWIAAWGILA
jgi:Bacterial PH domain/Domain of unknown function (DUF1648)